VGGDAGLIEAEEHRFGLDTIDPDADDVGQTVLGIPEHGDPFDIAGRGQQAPGVPTLLGGLPFDAPGRGQRVGHRTEPDGRRDVLEPGPPGTFLLTSDQKRFNS
jgi:hypothetical protein